MSIVLDVVASTLQLRVKQYTNLIENTNPVLRALKIGRYKKNRFAPEGKTSVFKTWSGGTHIEIPVRYAPPSSVQWYDNWDVLSNEVNDGSAIARYEWRMAQIPVFFSGKELAMNAGDPKVVDLVKSRIEAAEQEFFNALNKQLMSTAVGPFDINSLTTFITTANTTGVVGGIDRATNAWWRNLVFELYENNAANSFDGRTGSLASRIGNVLHQACRILSRGESGVDVILAGSTIYAALADYLWSSRRADLTTNAISADLGWDVLMFNNIPVLPITGYDYSASSLITNAFQNQAYLINTDHLQFRVHPARNFAMSEKIKLQDRDAEGFRIFFMGNLVASSLNHHGIINWTPAS